jgi:nucleoside-diphosphate-sugar epimerase
MAKHHLLIFGLGYSGLAIAKAAIPAGFVVTATSRTPPAQPEPDITIVPFDAAEPAIAAATHIITTAAPDEHGDPILACYAAQITAAPNLNYIGYLSTTGIYGDQNGGWVDEDTPPNPQSPRAQRRIAAEQGWSKFVRPDDGAAQAAQSEAGRTKVIDIFRLAGIYGPGRSMFDDLRAGNARRVVKPGHLFGRIHLGDIAQGVLTAMQRPAQPGATIFNFADDEPAASADVVVEAAKLLNIPPPDPVPYEQATQKMSPMALSFWSENRRVSAEKTKAALNLAWKYPTYREGLRAILAEERAHRPA